MFSPQTSEGLRDKSYVFWRIKGERQWQYGIVRKTGVPEIIHITEVIFTSREELMNVIILSIEDIEIFPEKKRR